MKNNYVYIALIGMSGIIGGAINYAYHPIMLKFMTLENFGIFGSLVGIFNILGVISRGIDLFLNKEFSKSLENKQKLKGYFYDSTKVFSILGIFLYVLYLFFTTRIADFLNISNYYLVVVTGSIILISFIGISTGAILKSIKKFGVISYIQILNPLTKLIFGVGLVFMGLGLFGAIYGFIISGIISMLLSFYIIFIYFKGVSYNSNVHKLISNLFSNKKEILNFFFTSLFFAIFMNIDVIIVRNLFSAEDAGIYAGIAVLGKFMIFLLLSIETVYFGQIMEHEKHKVPFHLLKNPLIIMAITVVAGITFNLLFGEFILNILKPELTEYLSTYILILGYYSILAFISFFIKILTGWKCYYVNYISAALSILLVAIVYIFGGESLEHFALSFIIFGIISVVILGSIFVLEYRRSRKISIKNMQSKDINTITHM